MSQTVSDAVYQFVPPALALDTYAVNGLNQYTSINGVTVEHDQGNAVGNGNLTVDHRGHGYAYDAENVMRAASGLASGTAAYDYWADGARRRKSYGGGVSTFYYDGDQEIAEYSDPGGTGATLTRRYIRLPGSVDEPLLMIDYTLDATCTNSNGGNCERWAHQNLKISISISCYIYLDIRW